METTIKIIDVPTALFVFEYAANKHAEATEASDFKTANKSYHNIVRAIGFLRKNHTLDHLLSFLHNSSNGVHIWAASYLLAIHERECVKVLEEIQKRDDIHSFNA